jgi:hypothetical protein
MTTACDRLPRVRSDQMTTKQQSTVMTPAHPEWLRFCDLLG